MLDAIARPISSSSSRSAEFSDTASRTSLFSGTMVSARPSSVFTARTGNFFQRASKRPEAIIGSREGPVVLKGLKDLSDGRDRAGNELITERGTSPGK